MLPHIVFIIVENVISCYNICNILGKMGKMGKITHIR